MDATTFFRKSAVENTKSKVEGQVLIAHEPSYTILALFLVFLIVVTLLFFSFASFNSYETVKGTLNFNGGILKIYPATNSAVKKLLVKNGKYVEKGTPLAVLKPETSRVNGTMVIIKEKEHLEYQITNYLSQKKEVLNKKQYSSEFLTQKKDRLRNQLSILESKFSLHRERAKLSNNALKRVNALYMKKGVSLTELNQERSQNLAIRSLTRDLEGEVEDLKHQMSTVFFEIKNTAVESQTTLLKLDNEVFKLNQRLAEINNLIEHTVFFTSRWHCDEYYKQ
jgi:multidrug resistance efflux pump